MSALKGLRVCFGGGIFKLGAMPIFLVKASTIASIVVLASVGAYSGLCTVSPCSKYASLVVLPVGFLLATNISSLGNRSLRPNQETVSRIMPSETVHSPRPRQ